VLEHDGHAYRAALEHSRKRMQRAAAESVGEVALRAAKERLEEEERSESRLFVIDAGLDPEALRSRYPQRNEYVIVRGHVELAFDSIEKSSVHGRIAGVDVDSIRVPHAFRSIVEPFATRGAYVPTPRNPRFAATVLFGQRLEPWIVELNKL
jgi:hypothetical protein